MKREGKERKNGRMEGKNGTLGEAFPPSHTDQVKVFIVASDTPRRLELKFRSLAKRDPAKRGSKLKSTGSGLEVI